MACLLSFRLENTGLDRLKCEMFNSSSFYLLLHSTLLHFRPIFEANDNMLEEVGQF